MRVTPDWLMYGCTDGDRVQVFGCLRPWRADVEVESEPVPVISGSCKSYLPGSKLVRLSFEAGDLTTSVAADYNDAVARLLRSWSDPAQVADRDEWGRR